jgi:hypothetical protein
LNLAVETESNLDSRGIALTSESVRSGLRVTGSMTQATPAQMIAVLCDGLGDLGGSARLRRFVGAMMHSLA